MGLQGNKYFTGRTIFLISPEAWNFVYVSKHHYAMELAKRGNKVFFIQPPRPDIDMDVVIQPVTGIDNLFLVEYKPLIRGLRFLPAFVMHLVERKFLRKLERLATVQFDTILNFENSRFYDFRFAPNGVKKIYFQVDEDQNYHPVKASTTSDITFTINEYILNLLKPYQPNIFRITHSFHGCLSSEAQMILDGGGAFPVTKKTITAAYVGNIDNAYVEKNILLQLIKDNPEVVFKLVGPYNKETYRLFEPYTNIKLTGKVDYKDIPLLLMDADILLLLLNKRFLGSSHKMMEYLASGKVIISTAIEDYSGADHLINIASGKEDYLQKFKDIKENISKYNTSDKMKERIMYAMERTYSRNLDRIDAYIDVGQGSES